jgi:hypothetical protein
MYILLYMYDTWTFEIHIIFEKLNFFLANKRNYAQQSLLIIFIILLIEILFIIVEINHLIWIFIYMSKKCSKKIAYNAKPNIKEYA